MTDALAIFEDDGVDGAQHAGILGKLVQMGNYRLFEGMRDVGPGKAAGFQFRQKVGQRGLCHIANIDVHEFVSIVEPCARPSRIWSAGDFESWISAPIRPT